MKKRIFRLKAEATCFRTTCFRTRPRGFRLQAEVVALAALIAVGSSVLLGGQAPPQQPPTFRGSAEAVQMSVIVTDREGSLVSGLTEDDFEILEDGKPRQITTFSAVDIP